MVHYKANDCIPYLVKYTSNIGCFPYNGVALVVSGVNPLNIRMNTQYTRYLPACIRLNIWKTLYTIICWHKLQAVNTVKSRVGHSFSTIVL